MKALIGKKAPEFHAPAVVNGNEIIEDFSLEQYVGKKYVVMFFYPMDFTFVCPTELHAFQQKLQEFERRNVAVVGCSVDSQFSHFAWLNQDKNKGGIHGVTYPLVSDFSKPSLKTLAYWPLIILRTKVENLSPEEIRSLTGVCS